MKFYRSRSFDDLGQRSFVDCLSIFSKKYKAILIKCHMQPSDKGEMFIFDLGHMTKMAALPIYVKTLNIFLEPLD